MSLQSLWKDDPADRLSIIGAIKTCWFGNNDLSNDDLVVNVGTFRFQYVINKLLW